MLNNFNLTDISKCYFKYSCELYLLNSIAPLKIIFYDRTFYDCYTKYIYVYYIQNLPFVYATSSWDEVKITPSGTEPAGDWHRSGVTAMFSRSQLLVESTKITSPDSRRNSCARCMNGVTRTMHRDPSSSWWYWKLLT